MQTAGSSSKHANRRLARSGANYVNKANDLNWDRAERGIVNPVAAKQGTKWTLIFCTNQGKEHKTGNNSNTQKTLGLNLRLLTRMKLPEANLSGSAAPVHLTAMVLVPFPIGAT